MKTITIFGSTGDLSARKLFPAFYNMVSLHQLDDIQLIAIGRKHLTQNDFSEYIKPKVKEYARLAFDEEIFEELLKKITYIEMDLSEIKDYEKLNHFYKQHSLSGHTFYLALNPSLFHEVLQGLKKLDLSDSNVVLEKPFGKNTQDMMLLNQKLKEMFQEDSIFYIDHYLGKEMIQNIKTIRFKNALFKNSWNYEMIESIQISALEKDGVLNRGSYYDQNGALKDMVSNHMFQILTILTMEEETPQHEKQLEILKHLKIEEVILGQYKGYLEEKDVKKDSTTETYAELKCTIDNDRFRNVPIYIRTGKKLGKREIEVIVKFKSFDGSPNNLLQIKIQPTEGVYLQFNIKKPGEKDVLQTVKMDFCQSCVEINRINTPEAYERLLTEVLLHQREYFSSFEEILTSTRMIENLKKPLPFIYDRKIENSLTEWIEIDHTS